MEKLGTFELLNVKEVSELLNIGQKKCMAMFESEDFPALKLGKRYLVNKEALYEYINSRQTVNCDL